MGTKETTLSFIILKKIGTVNKLLYKKKFNFYIKIDLIYVKAYKIGVTKVNKLLLDQSALNLN